MLTSLDDMWRFATAVVKARMAPKSLDSTEKILIALQMGAEVGLTPMQSLKNIAVINGAGAMWGDALVALVRRSPACEYIDDKWTGSGETRKAICESKRRGDPKICTREFGYSDAKRAGLISRDTYRSYPDRMYQCRARAWVLHDLYPDLLMGLGMVEELQDQQYIETIKPEITSGDDAPLTSLDAAAELLAADEHHVTEAEFTPTTSPSAPTPEELADPQYAAAVQSDIPF